MSKAKTRPQEKTHRESLRLSDEELNTIKETVKDVFGKEAKIFIFGSRIDPNKKGGDIDILIKSPKNTSISEKLSFLTKLEIKGISRKVDLLMITPQTKLKKIHKDALNMGLEI